VVLENEDEVGNMRNINRIPKILAAIKEVWLESPDMRLGQLLINIVSQKLDSVKSLADDYGRKQQIELFMWNNEEDEWLELIKRFKEKYRK